MVKSYSKFASCATVILIYILTFLVIYIIYPYLNFSNELLNMLVADLIGTIIIFIFSLRFNNSSMYDPYWSVVPPIIAIHLALMSPVGNPVRQLVIIALILFWSLRLTINFFRGWPGLHHQDWRYTHLQKKTGSFYWPVSFLGIHLMPTLFVFLGCLPLWYSLSNPAALSVTDIVAMLITLVAIITEWLADEQMISFRKSNAGGGFIKSGLWAISRHPNYLGEICFWLGIFLFVTALPLKDAYWTVSGFLSMLILFKFISIPMMERRIKEKKPGYEDYVKKIPALFPITFKKYM